MSIIVTNTTTATMENLPSEEVKKIYIIGKTHYDNGKIKEALIKLKQVAKQNYLPAINLLASHYLLSTKKPYMAKPYIQKSFEQPPDMYTVANIGLYCLNYKEYALSLKCLIKAKELGIENLEYYIGCCNASLENYQIAIDIFESIYQSLPYLNVCCCGCDCIRLQTTCKCLLFCNSKYLHIDNTQETQNKTYRINIYRYLGECYRRIGNYFLACNYLEKAVNEGCKIALVLLANCHNLFGNIYLKNVYVEKVLASKNIKALKLLINYSNTNNTISIVNINMLIISLLQEKFEKSVTIKKKKKYMDAIEERNKFINDLSKNFNKMKNDLPNDLQNDLPSGKYSKSNIITNIKQYLFTE